MKEINLASWLVKFAPAVFLLAMQGSPGAVLTRTSAFDYDPATGLLTKEIIEPDNTAMCLVTAYTLDAFGNRTAATTRNCNGSTGSLPGSNSEAAAPSGDPVFASRTNVNVMDTRGQFVATARNALYNSSTNPNQQETRTYNTDFGTFATLTGPNNLTTAWYYDGFGRKSLEVRADGNGTQWAYFFCSGYFSGTASCPTINGESAVYVLVATPVSGPINAAAGTAGPVNGPVTKAYYDSLNREIRTETQGFDGTGTSTPIYRDTEYDSLGRASKVSRPYYEGQAAYWVSVTFDGISRVVTQTQPDNTVTTTTYNGLAVTVQNANLQTQVTTKNSQGQVVNVQDAYSKVLSFQYDPFGNPISNTDDVGNQTVVSYDIRGRMVQMIDPDMGTWIYAYDALGQLIRKTDAKSQTSTMTYDLLGRMLDRTEPDLTSTWYYDFYQGGASCNKGIGKLCQETTNTGYNKTISYDSLGRLGAVATIIDVPTPYGEGVTYDSNGRLATRTYPSGLVVNFTYTTLGYLQKITNS